jgi:hypothetical protein
MHTSRKSIVTVLSLGAAALAFSGFISDAAAQRAGYRWETHAKANVKFEVPNEWNATMEGDTLTTSSKDKQVAVEFVAVADMSKESAVETAVNRELLKLVPDAKNSGPARSATQGCMSGGVVTGSGHRKGRAVEYIAFVMGDGKGHGIVGLALANQGQFATHRNSVVEILNSVKAADCKS